MEHPSYITLHKSLEQVLRAAEQITETAQTRVMTQITLIMLRNCVQSPLVRYIGGLASKKKRFFFDDSIFFSYNLWSRYAEAVELVEACTIINNFPIEQIPLSVNISNSRFITRLHGAVLDYTTAVRVKLMGGEHNPISMNRINESVKLVLMALLIQRDGSIAKPDNLWDILIASSAVPNQHPMFIAYKSIIDEERGFSTKSSKEKAAIIIDKILQNGLIPYLLLFAQPAYTMVKALQNSSILSDPLTVIKLSYELLRIQDAQFNFDQQTILELINSLT